MTKNAPKIMAVLEPVTSKLAINTHMETGSRSFVSLLKKANHPTNKKTKETAEIFALEAYTTTPTNNKKL